MPPGHFNALFINDASLIAKDSVWDSFDAAIKQGAFIQWNIRMEAQQQTESKMYEIINDLSKMAGFMVLNSLTNLNIIRWSSLFVNNIIGLRATVIFMEL